MSEKQLLELIELLYYINSNDTDWTQVFSVLINFATVIILTITLWFEVNRRKTEEKIQLVSEAIDRFEKFKTEKFEGTDFDGNPKPYDSVEAGIRKIIEQAIKQVKYNGEIYYDGTHNYEGKQVTDQGREVVYSINNYDHVKFQNFGLINNIIYRIYVCKNLIDELPKDSKKRYYNIFKSCINQNIEIIIFLEFYYFKRYRNYYKHDFCHGKFNEDCFLIEQIYDEIH